MIKKAVVEIGKTPSILSGKKSTKVDKDNPLTDNEELKDETLVKKSMEALVKESKK